MLKNLKRNPKFYLLIQINLMKYQLWITKELSAFRGKNFIYKILDVLTTALNTKMAIKMNEKVKVMKGGEVEAEIRVKKKIIYFAQKYKLFYLVYKCTQSRRN